MTRAILLIGIIFSVAGTVIAQNSAEQKLVTLTVEVKGKLEPQGHLRLMLFDSEKNWLKKQVRLITVDMTKVKTSTFKIEDLPAGTYAMSVIHDKNNNGDLDMGMMGPEEPYGFSNNARGMFGPASFPEAALILDEDRSTVIDIH